MIKNSTNQHISFLMLSAADGSGVTTGTTFVAICKDGGGPVTATNSPVHKSNGAWTLDLSQAETNCDHLLAVMTISGAITAMVQVYPVDPASFKADVSALATATDISDIKGATWSASTDTLELIRDRVDFGINLTAGQNDFDPATDTVANVTTVQTCVSNSDMRGTDGANTVAPDNAGITSNGVAIAALNDFDPATDTVVDVTNVAVCASNTDMRGTDNANTVVPDNAGITSNGNAIAALNDTTPQEFWDALSSGTYATGSFGESILISQTGQRDLLIASHHIAADVHEFQPNALDGQAIDASAVTKLQAGLATTADLATVTKTGVQYTATAQSGDTIQVTLS